MSERNPLAAKSAAPAASVGEAELLDGLKRLAS